MANQPRTITRESLTTQQIQAMKLIASGINVGFDAWNELFTRGLAETECDDDDDMQDVLAGKGWELLREVEVTL